MPAHTSLSCHEIPLGVWKILVHQGLLLPASIILHELVATRVHLQTDLLYHRDVLYRSLTCGSPRHYLVRKKFWI